MIFILLGWIALLLMIYFQPYYPTNGFYIIPISLFMVDLGMSIEKILRGD